MSTTTTATTAIDASDSAEIDLPPELESLIVRHLARALVKAWRRDQEAEATADQDTTITPGPVVRSTRG